MENPTLLMAGCLAISIDDTVTTSMNAEKKMALLWSLQQTVVVAAVYVVVANESVHDEDAIVDADAENER